MQRTYALDTSAMSNCLVSPPVAVLDNTIRRASKGGVGANIDSVPAPRIWRATSLARMLGDSSSPLFVSTHLTEMGRRPVTLTASLIGLISPTPLS